MTLVVIFLLGVKGQGQTMVTCNFDGGRAGLEFTVLSYSIFSNNSAFRKKKAPFA